MNDVLGVVLAAGLGTRLRPATEHCPKPLIPVAGVEPLFFSLWKAYQLGIRKFVVNAHHLPDQVLAACKHFETLLSGSSIQVFVEGPEILGTGGALQNIFKKVFAERPPCDVFVQNGDTLSQFDLTPLLKGSERSPFAISRRSDHIARYGKLWVSADSEYMGVGSKLELKASEGVHFLGSYKITAKDIVYLLKDVPDKVVAVDLFSAVFYPLMMAGRSPVAHEIFKQQKTDSPESFWFDMTNEAFLLEAQHHVLSTLAAQSAWGELLKIRYPSGKFYKKNVFTVGLAHGHHVPTGPCVLVDEGGWLEFDAVEKVGANTSLIVDPHYAHRARALVSTGLQNASLILRLNTSKHVSLDGLSGTVRILNA